MARGTSGLRPTWQLLAAAVLLMAWGVGASLVEVIYGQWTGYMQSSITWAQAQEIVASRPLWVCAAFFLIICGLAADQISRKKATASSFWGTSGLMEELAQTSGAGWMWLAAALATLFYGFTILEKLQTHYFLQDDNYAQFVPGMIYGCRTFWSGHWPAWNPYQLLGSPLADVGVYAITYPVTHLTYLIARDWFHDETRMVDLFCWFHLTLACGFTFWMGRRLRLSPPLAAGVAICFSLSGFALVASRSWYYMTPTLAAIPLLVLLAHSFPVAKPGWRWTLAAAAVIGLLFHAGNAQMWAYCVGFFLLLVILRVWKEGASWRRISGVLPALIIGIGIALPLLIPQMLVTHGVLRKPFTEGVMSGLMSMLYPFPLTNSAMPDGMGTNAADPTGQYYYAGTIFTLAWLAGLAVLFVAKGARAQLKQNPLLTASILAFILALGHQGLLWTLQLQFPLLQQFTCPSKFLLFVHLFSLTLGAMVVQRLTADKSAKQWLEGGSFALLAILMLYHTGLCRQAFYVWADSPSYEIPSELTKLLRPDEQLHRIYPASTSRAPGAGYLQSLNHSFATMSGVASFEGYEPMWQGRAPMKPIADAIEKQPLEILRRYGVEFVVLHHTMHKDELSLNPGVNPVERRAYVPQAIAVATAMEGQIPVFQNASVEVFRINEAEPMARSLQQPNVALTVTLVGNSVAVKTKDLAGDGQIMVNYLWRPGLAANSGKINLPINSDEFGRSIIDIPNDTETVFISYSSNWMTPLLLGIVTMLSGFLLQRQVSVF